MRPHIAVRRQPSPSGQLDPQVLCRVIEQQHFPDFGFHQLLSAFYEPWEDADYLVHATLRHRFNRKQQRQTLLARPCGDEGSQIFRTAREMWAKVFCRSDSLGMARPIGFLAEQGLLLQFLPDGPSLASLMQQRREVLLVQGVRSYARWLAKLHASRRHLEAPAIRLDRDTITAVDGAAETIRHYRPDHEANVTDIAARLRAMMRHARNPHLPTLGHHRLDHIVYHQDVLSPMQFNAVALADPALDIGGVIGHLQLSALKYYGAYTAADPLIQTFLSEYRRHGNRVAPAGYEPYQAYAIFRHAARALGRGGFDALRVGLWLDKARSLL